MRSLTMLSALALILIACTDRAPSPPADQPVHPLLDDLDPPPLNRPIRPVQVRHDAAKLQLVEGDQPALLIVQGGNAYAGQMSASGTFTVSRNRIDFEPVDAEPLTIMYRLPDAIGSIADATGTGQLQLLDRSGPAGADRLVVLRRNGDVLFGEVWQRSAEPLTIVLSKRLRLVQTELREDDKAGDYTPMDLALYDGDDPIANLSVGKPVRASTSAGNLSVYVEASYLFESETETAGQYPREYILHAWLGTAENQE